MTPVACRYCGLPFKVTRVEPGRDYFCCTGCAMLARVPVDAQGQFPVNAQLISVLVTGFLYFNQLLFWLLSVLLAREDAQAALAVRFGWLAAGAALVVWAAVLLVQLREKSARAGDFVGAALVLAMHGVAFRVQPPSAVCMAGANALLLLWSVRGLLRRKRRSARRTDVASE
ncbi:hypothetical protein CMV30_02790 [Nibricoccus aquaticus]|uniref:Uncharacterized protein n=1 Tax=Nibricoccus aquaticus TaxID=2576891 RepID=A0A290Q9R8_9BACT|nr:hypothetical protein [Nibricoccus aquaticus]ATC62976.1 hypothetical protein CMV30_02790 [Nibricoccus aquaticus]